MGDGETGNGADAAEVTVLLREKGMCGVVSLDGEHACLLDANHGRHGWEAALVDRDELMQLAERAQREPLGVDISDYGDEWCAGFLAGQINALLYVANACESGGTERNPQ